MRRADIRPAVWGMWPIVWGMPWGNKCLIHMGCGVCGALRLTGVCACACKRGAAKPIYACACMRSPMPHIAHIPHTASKHAVFMPHSLPHTYPTHHFLKE